MPLAKARPEGGKTSNIKLPETGLATASPAAKKAKARLVLKNCKKNYGLTQNTFYVSSTLI